MFLCVNSPIPISKSKVHPCLKRISFASEYGNLSEGEPIALDGFRDR